MCVSVSYTYNLGVQVYVYVFEYTYTTKSCVYELLMVIVVVGDDELYESKSLHKKNNYR